MRQVRRTEALQIQYPVSSQGSTLNGFSGQSYDQDESEDEEDDGDEDDDSEGWRTGVIPRSRARARRRQD
jgi:hypothetical protein